MCPEAYKRLPRLDTEQQIHLVEAPLLFILGKVFLLKINHYCRFPNWEISCKVEDFGSDYDAYKGININNLVTFTDTSTNEHGSPNRRSDGIERVAASV